LWEDPASFGRSTTSKRIAAEVIRNGGSDQSQDTRSGMGSQRIQRRCRGSNTVRLKDSNCNETGSQGCGQKLMRGIGYYNMLYAHPVLWYYIGLRH
jgi:hypothetical protein